MPLVLDGVDVSSEVYSALKGKLTPCVVEDGGIEYPTEGSLGTSTGGARATILHQPTWPVHGIPSAGMTIKFRGDDRTWRILNVSSTPETSHALDLARGLEPGRARFAPVELAVAAFGTYVQLTVVPPAVLARGHRLKLDWMGPTSGSGFYERGIVQITGLTPSSEYAFSEQEFDADGNPSQVVNFAVRTTE